MKQFSPSFPLRVTGAMWLLIPITMLLGGVNRSSAQPNSTPFDSTWYGFNTSVGSQPYFLSSARLADLDNDGDLDIVASKYWAGFMGTANGFVVLKNDGRGFFNATPVHYSSPQTSQFAEAADLNNDGFKDVVVSNSGANYQGSTISVYLNLGDGTFGSPSTYTVGTGPAGIASADFNGDGNVDLAVANYGTFGSQNTVKVLLNSGNGAFVPAVSYPAGSSPFRIAAARINSDSAMDLVVANENGFVNVLMNSGTGGFSPPTEYSVSQLGNGLFPSISVADVDNDGDIDVLYSNLNLGSVKLFRNQGGLFSPAETVPMEALAAGVMDLETADLNRDGWLDLVATSTNARTSDGYQVALNNGSGGFLPAFRNPAGQNTADIMLGDVDNDGLVDILTADSYSTQITVHRNFGQAFFPLPHLSSPGNSIAGSIDAADIDGDGDLDVVTSASGRAATGVTVKVQKNLGNGVFSPGVTYSIRGGGVQAKFRDLNGDNNPDLLFATAINSPPYDFHYAINNGDGTFGPVQTKAIGSCGWYDIDAFDLDNDGDKDVVITEWLGCPNITFSGQRLFICLNDGNATFANPLIKVIGPGVSAIAGADFNGDGKIDIATATSGALINISAGIGNGDFVDPVPYSIGDQGGATDLVIEDFNGDGALDIASSNFWESTTMSILFGNSNGTFQPAVILPSAYSPDLLNVSGITAGDVDNDGDKDIMVGNNASNCISLYTNDNGSFRYSMRIGGYSGVSSPFFADFSGDGKGDLVALGMVPPSGIGSTLMFIRGKNTGVTSVAHNVAERPNRFTLEQNFPNPFNPTTSITFQLDSPGFASLKIYDALGREVATLVNEVLGVGRHSRTLASSGLATGVYYYRLQAGGGIQTRKMVLIK